MDFIKPAIRKEKLRMKKKTDIQRCFEENFEGVDSVEIKKVGNSLQITPLNDEPQRISEIQFYNDSCTASYFTVRYLQKEWNGDIYERSMATGNLYWGQRETMNVGKEVINREYLCPTVENGIRVDSAFNHDTCDEKWIFDPEANCRAKYRASGSEFNLKLNYDGTEEISPPIQPGEGELKLINTCGVSTLQGLLQQVIIEENGKGFFSKTWDTHNAGSVYRVGLKKGANYFIHLREVYNMAMPQEVPAYIYMDAYINIHNCQAHDGSLTLIGTGVPTGKEDYTFEYNGKHYGYAQTLNIEDC